MNNKTWILLCQILCGLLDSLLLVVSFKLSYLIRLRLPYYKGGSLPFLGEGVDAVMPFFVVGWLICLGLVGLYRIRRRWEFTDILFAAGVGNILGVMVLLLGSYLSRNFYFPRLMLPILWCLATASVFANRGLLKAVLMWGYRRSIGTEKILLVGSGPAADMFLERVLYRPELGFDLVGVVPFGGAASEKKVPVFACGEKEIPRVADEQGAHVVVFTGILTNMNSFPDVVEGLQEQGIRTRIVPYLFDVFPRGLTYDEMGDVPVVSFRDLPFAWWDRFLKRAMDVLGSGIGLFVLAPFLGAICLLIRRQSHGQALFKQERIGRDGRPFVMIKFRSMHSSAAQLPPTKVMRADPRVTRIGGFLRRHSLDELPQLINVFLGHMSLVGPRPETRLYVQQYNRWHRRRLTVKPGITGFAQAQGIRGNTTIDEKTRLDLEYIERQSILLDVKILLKTLLTFWSHPEAY